MKNKTIKYKLNDLIHIFYLVSSINREADNNKLSNDLYSKLLFIKYKLAKYYQYYENQNNLLTNKYLKSEEYTNVIKNEEKLDEEKLNEKVFQINLKFQAETNDLLNKEFEENIDLITEEEFKQIIRTNLDNNPIIGGKAISNTEFFDSIYTYLLQKKEIV